MSALKFVVIAMLMSLKVIASPYEHTQELAKARSMSPQAAAQVCSSNPYSLNWLNEIVNQYRHMGNAPTPERILTRLKGSSKWSTGLAECVVAYEHIYNPMQYPSGQYF